MLHLISVIVYSRQDGSIANTTEWVITNLIPGKREIIYPDVVEVLIEM